MMHLIKVNELFVIFVVLIITPFFDLMTGYFISSNLMGEGSIASPSQLIRIVIFGLLVYLLRKKLLFVAMGGLMIFYSFVEIYVGILHMQVGGTISGFVMLYKVMYIFLLALLAVNIPYSSQVYVQIKKLIVANSLIISAAIILSLIFGFGEKTYTQGFGTKSFFPSGNGLGIYLGSIGLILVHFYRSSRDKIVLLAIFVTVIATVATGTKTALILALAIIITLTLVSRYRSVVLVLSFAFVMIFSQQIYFAISTIFDVILWRFEKSENIFTFIASGRLNYVLNAWEEIRIDDIFAFRIIFGAGGFVSFQDPSSVTFYDTLETDLFDVFFMYGGLGVVLYFSLFFLLFYKVRNEIIILGVVTLLFFHSLMAGHVIFNGMSSSVIFISLLSVLNRSNNGYIELLKFKLAMKALEVRK